MYVLYENYIVIHHLAFRIEIIKTTYIGFFNVSITQKQFCLHQI